jgi:type II secretory pathway pseudopilin PulG
MRDIDKTQLQYIADTCNFKLDVHSNCLKNQRGFGLIEMMVSMTLSLLAVAVMVILMSSTLGVGTATIQMSRLTQELRASIQLMSRDLRRANYHSSFRDCFANVNCRTDLGIAAHVNTININGAGNCFWYWLDRNSDANLANDAVGGFRYSTIGGVGVLQMRIEGNAAANCDDDTGWELITDPDTIDIASFNISKSESYDEIVSEGYVQKVEKLRLIIIGRMASNPTVNREIQDLILIRNDIIQLAGTT